MSDSWKQGKFTVSTNKNVLDYDVIYQFLTEKSYWAQGMTRDTFEKSLQHSPLCFGLFDGDPCEGNAIQIGFARVISDKATFAFLADVFVIEAYRGRGLSKWMLQVIVEHPELQGLRRFMLGTKDAHTLYEKFGFQSLVHPEIMMEKSVYWSSSADSS